MYVTFQSSAGKPTTLVINLPCCSTPSWTPSTAGHPARHPAQHRTSAAVARLADPQTAQRRCSTWLHQPHCIRPTKCFDPARQGVGWTCLRTSRTPSRGCWTARTQSSCPTSPPPPTGPAPAWCVDFVASCSTYRSSWRWPASSFFSFRLQRQQLGSFERAPGSCCCTCIARWCVLPAATISTFTKGLP